MAFRNEQDALRERVEVLDRELTRTRARSEARERDAEAAEARASQLERELASARKELARLAPKAPAAAGPRVAVFVAAGIAMLGAVTAVLLSSAPSPSVEERPIAATVEPRTAEAPRAVAVVHEASVREVRAWPPLRPGDRCRVESTLRDGRGIDVEPVVVRCGDRVLYDSAAPPTGMVISSSSSSAVERRVPGAGERYAYAIVYEDQGTRSLPMAQLVLRTAARTARVFRSPESEGLVVLDVERWSEPVEGAPLVAASASQELAFAGAVRHTLEVHAVEGAAPVEVGAPCSLLIEPELANGPFDCRVLVRCGTILYGAGTSGYNRCELEGGQVTRVDDATAYTDGDPELHFDAAAGTLTIRDDPPEGEWTARLRVIPAE